MYLDLTAQTENAEIPEELATFCCRDFNRLAPFESILLDFCQYLSHELANQNDPDIAALGFWLRPAHVNELQQKFKALAYKNTVRTARGLVFHITASNVDTLFAYSWILSLLMGNANIVRLPAKQSPAIESILGVILDTLKQKKFAPIADSTCMLRYARQRTINEFISAHADIRIIWGSNETVREIRTIPLNPYAKEIAFPDRFSYSMISAAHYLRADDEYKTRLSQAFFRDAYGFDQHGCSSPRLVVWVGDEEEAKKSSSKFFEYLFAEIERRGYRLPLSDVLHKQTALYVLCATLPVMNINRISNELTIATFENLTDVSRKHPGAGLFYQATISDLSELGRFVSLQDQTLTFDGFDRMSVEKLAASLNGKGPSRFVPIGEALQFSAVWDGIDLLQELTRCIEVQTASFSIIGTTK